MLYGVSNIGIAIRWAYDWIGILWFAATLSIAASALLYLAFASLGRLGPVLDWARDWIHLPLILTIAIFGILHSPMVEVFLVVAKLVYSLLLIRLACKSDSLQLVRLGAMSMTRQLLWISAIMLVISIVVDVAISIDFALYQGSYSERLVGIVNLLVLTFIGWAAVFAGSRLSSSDEETHDQQNTDSKTIATAPADGYPESISEKTRHVADSQTEHTNQATNEDTKSVLYKLEQLLVEEKLYADTELNLQRLARKAGVPARTISKAINTHTGQNVSQWVNRARIEAACVILENAEVSVTQAMMDSGFLTKSNFNREFRRIKGCSPTEWRASTDSKNNAPRTE